MNESEQYCREIEAYLCKKNEGHLIRIVGPAFELVSGWAARGVPLKVAFAGIDRYLARESSRRPRRRPVRVEFCEADVLDAFDGWRRSVGVLAGHAAGDADSAGSDAEAERRRSITLASHIARALSMITGLRGSGAEGVLAADVLERSSRALDALHSRAGRARGQARDDIIRDLASLDAEMLAAARAVLAPAEEEQLTMEADRELQPFRARMRPEAYARAREAAQAALVRQRFELPRLAYE